MMDEKFDSPCQDQTIVDRISELPEEIVHRIMQFIGYPEDVKTSILSKRWLLFRSSFPFLKFDQTDFDNKKDDFVNAVDKSLCRFSTHNLTVSNFIPTVTDPNLSSFIDQWISFLLARYVKVLCLNFIGPSVDTGTDLYVLPPNIFSSKSITSLWLNSCKIKLSSICGSNGSVINFNYLRHLTLHRVQLDDDQVINTLLSSSPLLEILFINCKNLTTLRLSGHKNLRSLMVHMAYNDIDLKKVDIESLNLEYVDFRLSNGFRSSINMSTCQNLKSLAFSGVDIESFWLQETISIFPLLERVELSTCYLEKKINIKSSVEELYHLGLPWIGGSCHRCPKFALFALHGDELGDELDVSLTTTSLSAKWEVHITAPNQVDTLWFHKLREFLPKTNRVKVLDLHISFREVKMEELQACLFSCTNGLEHLKLHNIRSLSANYQSLVHGLLIWCCRPQTLSSVLHSGLLMKHDDTINFLKDAYQKLMQQEDPPYDCCSKNISVEIGRESGKIITDAIHLDALLNALPTLGPELLVRFRIEKK